MNSVVLRLLSGFLARSAWVYAAAGLVVYIMDSAFWALRIGRVPLAGVLLGMWGSAAAFNARSLVWRSLPINFSDIALYRWWAAVGAPGFFLTLITIISWGAQVSSRLPAPEAPQVLVDVLASWAALGLLTAVWDEIRYRPAIAAGRALTTIFAIYGLPVADRPWATYVFVAAGVVLLLLGFLKAGRALDKRWATSSTGPRFTFWKASTGVESGSYGLKLYGLKSFYLPAMRYTAALTAAAVLVLAIAQKLVAGNRHASADTMVLLVVFVGLSTSSSLLTYRLRFSTQTLRSLPLSPNRLAGVLQLIGVLPGVIAAMLTLLTARLLLHFNVDIWSGASCALSVSSCIGLAGYMQKNYEQPQFGGALWRLWLPLIQNVVVSIQVGMAFTYLVDSGYWNLWIGVSVCWIWLALAIFFFALGHYGLVRYLRAGIRPSAEQNVFSAG